MKKSICLYFQVHQPQRLRLYRFFDIGKDSHYYDDFTNRTIMRRVSQKCYLPMNELLLGLLKQYKGKFKVAFSRVMLTWSDSWRAAPMTAAGAALLSLLRNSRTN